jgi:hypothetical protein
MTYELVKGLGDTITCAECNNIAEEWFSGESRAICQPCYSQDSTELSKCKTCDEQIDRAEHECDYCEDCCHELQMSWQTNDVS